MAWTSLLFLAFITHGALPIHAHFTQLPLDQPAYPWERKPPLSVLLSLGLWWVGQPPIAALISLMWTFAIYAAGYWLLGTVIHSTSTRLAILSLVPICILLFALRAKLRRGL